MLSFENKTSYHKLLYLFITLNKINTSYLTCLIFLKLNSSLQYPSTSKSWIKLLAYSATGIKTPSLLTVPCIFCLLVYSDRGALGFSFQAFFLNVIPTYCDSLVLLYSYLFFQIPEVFVTFMICDSVHCDHTEETYFCHLHSFCMFFC
jgi:hypothetical protein